MSTGTKEVANKVTDAIFMMFGGVYKKAVQELSRQAPEIMYQSFVSVVNEGRRRSGLPRAQTLAMLKALKKAVDRIIESEGG